MIGTQIKKLLAAREMTQTTLAEEMHISDSKLSKIISGALEPNITDLELLSNIFDVTLDELVFGKKEEKLTLLEQSIQNGPEAFKQLIQTKPEQLTRVDDKGRDMFYYIRKHNAYELLVDFYFMKGKQVSTLVQRYYVNTVVKLLQDKSYEQYQALLKQKFKWDLSALCVNEEDDEKIYHAFNDNSQFVIYEVIKKNQKMKSQTQKFFNKDQYKIIELSNYVVFVWNKKEFDAFCDAILMQQLGDPMYLNDSDRKKTYLPTYISNTNVVQQELVAKLMQRTLSKEETSALQESYFLSGKDEMIWDLYSKHLEENEYVDLTVAKNEYCNRPQQYFRIQQQFVLDVEYVQNYFKLCIKHNNKLLFAKLLKHPKLSKFVEHAKQEQLAKLSDYENRDYKPEPITFFDFEMSKLFKDLVKQEKFDK